MAGNNVPAVDGNSQGIRLADHVALIVSGALAVAFVIKLLFVSHGSTTTMFALLTNTTLAQTMTGVAIVMFPAIYAGLLGALFGRILRYWGRGGPVPGPTFRALLIPAGILGLFVSFWTNAVGLLIVFVWFLVEVDVVRQRSERKEKPASSAAAAESRYVLTLLLFIGAFVIAFALTATRVWLPPQEFATTNGARIVGYELSKDANAVTVMRDDNRRVVDLANRTIRSARYCNLPTKSFAASLLEYLTQPDYPRCRSRRSSSR